MVAVGIGSTLAAATWLGYSILQRAGVDRGTYLAARLLAETRRPDGDPAALRPRLARLPTVPAIPADRNIRLLAGAAAPAEGAAGAETTVYRCGDLYVQATTASTAAPSTGAGQDAAASAAAPDFSYALFGHAPRVRPSLRQLVQQQTKRFVITEDVERRLGYMRAAERSREVATVGLDARDLFRGAYRFCFRDYVNFEELTGMLVRRRCMELLLIRLRHATTLAIEASGACRMTDSAFFLLGIPLATTWYGTLRADRIEWDRTAIRLGWRRFGKTFDRPKVAEKLRQDPWVVRLPEEDYPLWDGSGDVMVLNRLGSGTLVFCRDACLKAERK